MGTWSAYYIGIKLAKNDEVEGGTIHLLGRGSME
jgi:hypothetical protein